MSNSLAIAAATNALRNLLLNTIRDGDAALSDLDVTTRTPDTARKNVTTTSLNLFLYQTQPNAAWRNLDMPRQVRPGESANPPLALNLHYLITAYGRDDSDQDALSHRVLGGAMRTLHDHPLLGAGEIRGALANNDLADQIERVRITPLALSIEDMSKLWAAFQTNYRLSAAYEATVILIDSTNSARAPLPVLRRGEQDRGVIAVTGAAPNLKELRPPASQPATRLGEEVVIVGDNLQLEHASLRFTSLMRSATGESLVVELTPLAGDKPGEIKAQIADLTTDASALGRWAPGFYTVCQVLSRPDEPQLVSNEISFALAPTITLAPNSTQAGTVSAGDELTITCAPRVREGQRVLVLIGDRPLAPKTIANPSPTDPTFETTPTNITIDLPALSAGLHVVRLRVDGVDSIPMISAGAPAVPSFDPAQQVRV